MKKNAKFWKALPVAGALVVSLVMFTCAWINVNVVSHAFLILVIAGLVDIVLVNFDRDRNGTYVVCASYGDALTKTAFWMALVVLMALVGEYLILHYNNWFGMEVFTSGQIQIPFWYCVGCGIVRLAYHSDMLPKVAYL